METGLSSLEKELKQWRENRSSRALQEMAAVRQRIVSTPPLASGRRVHVNGQEILVVSKSRRSS
jgi:hypothetical protein